MAGHIARWLRDEEAAGSNPATPTSSKARFPLMGGGPFPSVRHWCVITPRPRLLDLAMRIRSQVGIALGGGIVLMTKQRLHVI